MMVRRVPKAARELAALPPPSGASTYIPPGATAAEVAAVLAEAHPAIPRKAARRRRVVPEPSRPAPGPYTVLKDNVLCVSIPLQGEHGEGHRAVVDLLQWDRVQLLAGSDWMVRVTDSGVSVVSYRQQARRLTAARDGSAAFLVLSRFVAGAKDGEVVSFLDGDPFHIRRCNLVVEGRREHWDAHRVRLGGPRFP